MLLGLEKLKKKAKILIGLSGGVDSMSLFYALLEKREAYELDLYAVYMNHLLREESAKEEKALEELCKIHSVPFFSERLEVKVWAELNKTSIEAAGHTLRHEAFKKLMERYELDYLALGHTQDDRAETFLMNLLYGAGLVGLSALPLFEGKIWRPLIETQKERLFFYAREKGFTYFHDASNDSLVYFRNEVRHKLLPFLESYQPKLREKLAHTAERLSESKEALETLAEAYLITHLEEKEGGYALRREALLKEPIGLVKMILFCLINRYVPEARGLNEARWVQLIQSLEQTQKKRILVKGDWWFESRGEWLFLKEMTKTSLTFWEGRKPWTKATLLPLGELHETTRDEGLGTCKLILPIYIRFKKAGDRVYIKGLGHKKLKKLFQEKGIREELRNYWPIFEDEAGEVIWIPEVYKNWKNQTIIKPCLMLKWSLDDQKEE